MAMSQLKQLFAVLCLVILGSVAADNTLYELPQPHRQLDDGMRLSLKSYAVWGGPLGAWADIVAFDLKTGVGGQVVLKNDGYVSPVAPAVEPATRTLFLPIVEIGPGGSFGAPKLAVVNATSEPWVITRRISLGPDDPMVMQYMGDAFFDPVRQRVWVLALQMNANTNQLSQHLWSVDPATNNYKKIELGPLLPNSTLGVKSLVFNPSTRSIAFSIMLLGKAAFTAIAMFDVDRGVITMLSPNNELGAAAMVWDSSNKQIYSFLTKFDGNGGTDPALYYGSVGARTGAITPLHKYDASYDGMEVWGNPIFDPTTNSFIAALGFYDRTPSKLVVFEPATGSIKLSSTFMNSSYLHQMFLW